VAYSHVHPFLLFKKMILVSERSLETQCIDLCTYLKEMPPPIFYGSVVQLQAGQHVARRLNF